MCTRSGNDFVGTIVFVRKFLRGLSSAEVFCFNKSLFSDFEVRRGRSAVVHGPLIACFGLGELVSEFRVKFIQVNHIFVSTLRS